MQLKKINRKIIDGVCLILIMTFIYAAFEKGMDLTFFRNQMMQSPLLPTTQIVQFSIIVPILEIAISILLFFEITRKWGLLFSYSLMLLFSLYMVTLVLYFGDNIPCACGGILGKMGYPVHITFNIVLTILSLYSYIKIKNNETQPNKI